MDEDVKNALRLTEKINDRHEASIAEHHKAISALDVVQTRHSAQLQAISQSQIADQKQHEEIKKAQVSIILWKAKLTAWLSALQITILAAYEILRGKF